MVKHRKKYVPVYYRVDLSKTEYGHPEVNDETKTFTIKTPNVDGSGNAFKYDIKYYVDNSRKAADRITTDQQGADIDKDFIDFSSASGGAIYNDGGTIGDITGDFIGNYAQVSGSNSSAYGGAIFNYYGTIGDITGDFIGNYAQSNGTGPYSSASGGAIYNYAYDKATIGDIKGDFIGNYAQSDSYSAYGGAIFNNSYDSSISDITGNFIGNYAKSTGDSAYGGAIYYLVS